MTEVQEGRGGAIDDSAALLASIVESSASAITSETLEGIISSWNPAAERIFGYAAAEAIGRPVAMLAAPGREDEMPRILERIRAGERIADFETAQRRKDGSLVPVRITVSPIRDTNGRIIGASKIARDITERRSAEAHALAQADEIEVREAHLRSILETIPDAMIVIDERGTVQLFSAAAERLFGYAASEIVGRNVTMLMPSPHREGHDSYIARYLTTGERRIIGVGRVVSGLRKDGSTFPMELQVGEVAGARRLFTGFVRDLTERQRTEQRLQELQAELSHVSRLSEMGQMASALAHELNQPLTATANYLQAARRLMARGDEASFARASGALESAAQQIARAGQIIRGLRDFVKKTDTAQQSESVVKLLEEASALALIGAKERGVTVHLRPSPDARAAVIDKVQIQQVLVNLLRNAVEAMETSPRRQLSLMTGLDGDFVRISVGDTGPGIAPEVAARLFQPFVTTKPQGMGVGLSICRTIIEAHGGRLWVESNAEGGTTFHFTVPATERAAAGAR